jgi:hypothetical protein
MQQSQDAAWNKLPPEQRPAKSLENGASLLKSRRYKTYEELSVTERAMKTTCTEQLLHPDQDIIKPSRKGGVPANTEPEHRRGTDTAPGS